MRTRRDGEAGVALLFVLWTTVALAALALPFARGSGEDARLLRTALEARHLDAAADAAVWLAADAVVAGRLAPGGGMRTEFAGTEITVEITGESGRVDLSAASADTLDIWLAAHGIEGGERARLRDALLDWRDGDGLRRPSGAEAPERRRAGILLPADRGFLHPFELATVPGFAGPRLSALLEDVTVHTGRPEPVAELAPATLRAQLDVPPGTAHREESTENGTVADAGDGNGGRQILPADPAGIYRLDIRVARGRLTKRVIAVVEIPPIRPLAPVLLERRWWTGPEDGPA